MTHIAGITAEKLRVTTIPLRGCEDMIHKANGVDGFVCPWASTKVDIDPPMVRCDYLKRNIGEVGEYRIPSDCPWVIQEGHQIDALDEMTIDDILTWIQREANPDDIDSIIKWAELKGKFFGAYLRAIRERQECGE